MSRKKNVAMVMAGVLMGSMLSGPAVHAAESYLKAYHSAQPIYLDGAQIQMEAYTINGSNYVKLRDVGEALGFNVYWDGAVQIDSDAPYTGTGPEAEVKPETQTTQAAPTPDWITASENGIITGKTITKADWSRRDLSQEANPNIFTGCYTRGWYNAIRQSIVNREDILAWNDAEHFNSGYLYAHTLVPGQSEAAFSRLLGQIRGMTSYRLGAEPYTKNQYEYPGYGIVKVCRADTMDAPLAYIQPKLRELAGKSDREKVAALNSYLCGLLDYGYGASAGVAEIFSPHGTPALGKCGSYSSAFSFLCEAAGIPCVIVLSADHSWNEVYVDGQWLTVDVTFNDAGGGRNAYLLSASAPRTDLAPDSTRFAKELLAPGSTTK